MRTDIILKWLSSCESYGWLDDCMTSALPPDSFYGLGFRIFYRARIALSNPFYVWNTACAFHGSHFNFILPRKLNSLSFVWNIHNDICFTGVKIFEGRLASLVPLRIFICHEIITLGKFYLNCVSSWLLNENLLSNGDGHMTKRLWTDCLALFVCLGLYFFHQLFYVYLVFSLKVLKTRVK